MVATTPIFQDDGNGPYLLPNVTAGDLAAWEAANNKRWENGQIVDIPLTPSQIQGQLTVAVQNYLDATARARGYDSIFTACTYEGDPNPTWSAEGTAFKVWRSAAWQHCLVVLTAVQAQTRAIPTEAELLAELPIFTA